MNPNCGKYSCVGIPGPRGPPGPPGALELDILIKKSSITGTTGSQNIPFNTQIVPSMSCPLSTSVISNIENNIFTLNAPVDDCAIYNVKMLTQVRNANLSICSTNYDPNDIDNWEVFLRLDPGNVNFTDIGDAVDIDGDVAVVGIISTAVNVYYRDQRGPNNWGIVATVPNPVPMSFDSFGGSVSVNGDTLVVGAPFSNGAGLNRGAAYVYYRDQGGVDNWGLVTTLVSGFPLDSALFGSSVSVNGDTIVVGAPRQDAGGFDRGAAYVYYRDQGGVDNWGLVTTLVSGSPQDAADFGQSVSVNGDTIVVGGPRQDAGGFARGAAYVYYRDQGGVNNWGLVTTIVSGSPENDARFGESVSVDGDTIVVGEPLKDGTEPNSGNAYVYYRDQGGVDNWGLVTTLISDNPGNGHQFGISVSISGDVLIVGERRGLLNITGDETGVAYIYSRNEGGMDNWGLISTLLSGVSTGDSNFGFYVAISGDYSIIGAPGEDDSPSTEGAAYIAQAGISKYISSCCTTEVFNNDLTICYDVVLNPSETREISFFADINIVPTAELQSCLTIKKIY